MILLTLALITFLAAQTDERAIALNSPSEWVTSDDYPEEALIRQEQGTVGFRLDIDRLGKITGCTIASTSGSSALDATTCALIQERAKFKPARKGGAPIADTYQQRVIWRLPDPEPPIPGMLRTVFGLGPNGEQLTCDAKASGGVPEEARRNSCEAGGMPAPLAEEFGPKFQQITLVMSVSGNGSNYQTDLQQEAGELIARREAEVIFSASGAFLACNRRNYLGDGPDFCSAYKGGLWEKEHRGAPADQTYIMNFALFGVARADAASSK